MSPARSDSEDPRPWPLHWPALRKNLLTWVIPVLMLAGVLSIELASPPWPSRSRFFPLLVTAVGLVLAVVNLVTPLLARLRRWLTPTGVLDLPSTESSQTSGMHRDLQALAWFLGLLSGVVILGAHASVALFLVLYLRYRAHMGWVGLGIYTTTVWLVLFVVFQQLLGIPWPTPLVLHFVEPG